MQVQICSVSEGSGHANCFSAIRWVSSSRPACRSGEEWLLAVWTQNMMSFEKSAHLHYIPGAKEQQFKANALPTHTAHPTPTSMTTAAITENKLGIVLVISTCGPSSNSVRLEATLSDCTRSRVVTDRSRPLFLRSYGGSVGIVVGILQKSDKEPQSGFDPTLNHSAHWCTPAVWGINPDCGLTSEVSWSLTSLFIHFVLRFFFFTWRLKTGSFYIQKY